MTNKQSSDGDQQSRTPSHQERSRRPETSASDVVDVCDLMQTNDITMWIDGGWGVDALLGKQTRSHGDLDVVVQKQNVPKIRELLDARGFREKGEDYAQPWNYILVDDRGREIDLHIIELDADGNGRYGRHHSGDSYTAHALSGYGTIGDHQVRCIAVEDMVRFHTGYDLKDKDLRDVSALCEAFGIELPDEYARFGTGDQALEDLTGVQVETGILGGSEQRDIILDEYNPAWPQRFESEQSKIDAALGMNALVIEHVGSTSVPGLAAKPIIDICLAVRDSSDEDAYVPDLEAAGYHLRVREPDFHEHRMLRSRAKDVHVHVFSAGSSEMRRMIAFRDWLRAHPEDREQYESTKRQLARKRWPSMQHYADAKTEVVALIMRRPEAATPGNDL